MARQLILSGIQPSGILTLGNYLGALRNWVHIQEEYECLYFIADLHSITVPQDPATLRANTKKALVQYLACGLDPDKNVIFAQSHVHEHPELAWVRFLLLLLRNFNIKFRKAHLIEPFLYEKEMSIFFLHQII